MAGSLIVADNVVRARGGRAQRRSQGPGAAPLARAHCSRARVSATTVPVDSKVRGNAEVVSIDEKGGGWGEVVTRFTLEVDGNEKPCFVGDSVTRVMAPTA